MISITFNDVESMNRPPILNLNGVPRILFTAL
jgi:hypothetical protein